MINGIYKKIVLEGDQKVWFISDTHYNHKNICRGTSSWDLKEHGGHNAVRDFDTLNHMNFEILNGINSNVEPDDWLIHLGDWSFGGIESIWAFRKQIMCNNVVLILGNHDHHIASNRPLPNATLFECDRMYPDNRPTTGELDISKEIRPHAKTIFNSVHGYVELTVSGPNGKNTYNLQHFPMQIWNKAHHGRKHLYGHVHGNFTNEGRAMDVGIDATFRRTGEYRPLSEEEVLRYMEGREYVQLSHHNSNTN